ncbi:MAG: acetate--CoA ligase family protein [Rhodospirillales bacterium]
MTAHRLDPLLRPASVAVLGASQREGSVGNTFLKQSLAAGFKGRLYPVNPRYDTVEGLPCYPSLEALPEPVEHVIFAIPNAAIEAGLRQAIACGVKAATMVSSLFLPDDSEPRLPERIGALCREADIKLCGANCMGFYNFEVGLWACGYLTRPNHQPGNVTFLTHSGSALCSVIDAEGRVDYNYVVSCGQELTVNLADYMDFSLSQPSTEVLAIFMETARDPERFEAALAKAAAKRIPVVMLKVGRTEESAKLATSHSGALVGDDGAYQALFERYGVHRVDSLDELIYTSLLFSRIGPLGPGGLATIHDSGGERELLMDLAHAKGVAFSQISPETTARLAARLDYGLPPVNPCDAWGTGNDFEAIFSDCLSALMQDPDTALGAVACDRGPEGGLNGENVRIARQAAAASGKPVLVCANHQGTGNNLDLPALSRAGLVVMDGMPQFLTAVRALTDHRDFQAPGLPAVAEAATVERWRARLSVGGTLDELDSLDLMQDFGIATVARRLVASREEALAAAGELGGSVVLKTAMPGIAHKSDVGGVILHLEGEAAVAAAYDRLARHLGPRVLVAAMAPTGVEMILGVSRDTQLGCTVVIGVGGIHAEVLKDVVLVRPPFDAAWARQAIDRLRLRPLLDGVRGQPAADIQAFAEAASRLSILTDALGDVLAEVDINPLIVTAEGCLAVDALVVPRDLQGQEGGEHGRLEPDQRRSA